MASSRKLPWEEDEWEYVNDDGFVYKRRKRCPDLTTASTAPTLPDPALVEKNRREMKRRALMSLREKHQREISQWELLSNRLKAMQEKCLSQQDQPQRSSHSTDDTSIDSPAVLMPEDAYYGRLLDEQLIEAEAEEAMIEDISNLCDVAEAICSSQEEHIKQSLLNLPIWALSPQELMKSLCDE